MREDYYRRNWWYQWAVITWSTLILLYVVSIGFILTLVITFILMQPVIVFQILIGRMNNNEPDSELLTVVIYFESMPIIWFIANFAVMNVFAQDMSILMICQEALYFWLMIWYFVTLILCSDKFNRCSLYLNPFVLTFLIVFFLLSVCFTIICLPYIVIKFWFTIMTGNFEDPEENDLSSMRSVQTDEGVF